MGHKSVHCCSKGGESNIYDDKGKKPDFSQRKCYECHKMGHMEFQCLEKNKETGLVVFMAREDDEEIAAGMLMSLDDNEYPEDGNSIETARAQVNLTRTEAIMEEHERCTKRERYQRVSEAVAKRRAEEALADTKKNCDFGYGCSPGLCGCRCKTLKDRQRLAKIFAEASGCTMTFPLEKPGAPP
jgi:hypothetical protein